MDASESSKTWTLDERRRHFVPFDECKDDECEIPSRCINVYGHTWKVMVHGDDCDEVAALLLAARNSYARHCPDPLAAAEGDLLGEALDSVNELLGIIEFGYAASHRKRVMRQARAVLAKAARKGGGA